MKKKTQLLIIDPQNDFCEQKGSLWVPCANLDMQRLAIMIKNINIHLDCVHVTLDSHHLMDIAHVDFWKSDSETGIVQDFTFISHDDIKAKKYLPRQEELLLHVLDYTKYLEKKKQYPLCAWPAHCLIGSWGHNIYEPLLKALWDAELEGIKINYISKGENPLSEHYSAIEEEVPLSLDNNEHLNNDLLLKLSQADRLLIAGEASSHCVLLTVYSIVKYLGDDYAKKIILLEDAMSPVATHENYQQELFDFMLGKEAKILKTTNYMK